MNFSEWYNEADMPTKLEDGTWVDLETGIAFNADKEFTKVRKSLSTKALDAREIAKAFGGKALVGTAKQKEWAEKIRAEKLKSMQFEDAILVCDPTGLLGNSKFWIENRNASASDIAAFRREQKTLLTAFKKLEKGTPEAFEIADKYNALTKKWGF